MINRTIGHLRRNAIGCLALFIALGGGAYAASTIGSSDIIDESIQSVDVKNGQITSADIGADALKREDLAPNSVGGSELGSNLGSAEVSNGSVTGADVNEATLARVPKAEDGTRQLRFHTRSVASRTFTLPESHELSIDCASGGMTIRYRNTAGAGDVKMVRLTTAGTGTSVIGTTIGPGATTTLASASQGPRFYKLTLSRAVGAPVITLTVHATNFPDGSSIYCELVAGYTVAKISEGGVDWP